MALAERNYARQGEVDLEALEQGLRAAALKDGAEALNGLLAKIADHGPGAVACPDCGGPMASHGRRSKHIVTLLGETELERTYYRCQQPGCSGGGFPKDQRLDVAQTSFSPGVRRLLARGGANNSFAQAEEDMRQYAGITVTAKDVERVAERIGAALDQQEQAQRQAVLTGQTGPAAGPSLPVLYIACDGTGVPVVRQETAGRRGKQADGSAKTREAKVGCVFTQTETDAEGFPLRDEGSTTYVGAIETADVFGERLYAEAVQRGLENADLVVVLGDGACWIWHLAALHFPAAVGIVDLYHAREHLHALLKLILPQGPNRSAGEKEWLAWLDAGQIEQLVKAAEKLLPTEENARKEATTEIEYFKNNRERMRYAAFRARGLFVGSGVVEAACKNIVAARMKKSGAKWSVRGANAIIALRCAITSNRFDDFWSRRRSA